MTISRETASTKHHHDYKRMKIWQEFRLKDSFMVRERERWNICPECMKRNRLKTEEYESYGIREHRGGIANLLPSSHLSVALQLMKDLYKSNSIKYWSKLRDKLVDKWDYELFNETISRLHQYGYLIINYRKNRVGLRDWTEFHVRCNEKFLKDIQLFLGTEDSEKPNWIQQPFEQEMKPPQTETGKEIHKILMEHKKAFESGEEGFLRDKEGNVIASSFRVKKVYYHLIRALHGLYQIVEDRRIAYWKAFSQELFGDTKALTSSHRKSLEQILEKKLTAYGLRTGRDEVLLSGDFIWRYLGGVCHSRAFSSYVPIPRELIGLVRWVKWGSPKLLIIENQDLFLDLIGRNYLDVTEWSIMFGSGYLSSEEIRVIVEAAKLGLKEVYVWPDLDPYGYRIAVDVKNKLEHHGAFIPIYLFGYDPKWFLMSPTFKQLKTVDRKEIDDLMQVELPRSVREVLELMKSRGMKGEQELLIECLGDKDVGRRIVAEAVRVG